MFYPIVEEFLSDLVAPFVITAATAGLMASQFALGCCKKKNKTIHPISTPLVQPMPQTPTQVVTAAPAPIAAVNEHKPQEADAPKFEKTAKTEQTAENATPANPAGEKKNGAANGTPSKNDQKAQTPKDEKPKPSAEPKHKKGKPKDREKLLTEHSAKDPEPDLPATEATQASVSQKVDHEDDTVKNIDSIKLDKHKSE